ncbi:tRNA (adenine(37)-N6)-methyltransferase isoform X2 [Ixodes scapularis]|uniref:tRNA (adenine(37)-N6)-methyltransferase isoform X2 n=1 Tax=Ixodes scapularis TaxID=6945 RepID=UPI001A9D5E50|nr:tRNA (adenine(37)-N6)-methyltransferase isoform X2 [Ixodes scapularis]
MSSVESLQRELTVCRNEISNLRKTLRAMNVQFKTQCADIRKALQPTEQAEPTPPEPEKREAGKENGAFVFAPIGRIRTAFPSKNATPRQACICSQSSATLSIDKEVFNRPQHCLDGLEEFSHVWLLSVLDRNNKTESGTFAYKSKVRPPRLDGRSVGVFGTRSPHRPCPIGLSLVRLDAVKDGTLHISGVDLVDGTPILDIKPYIPEYDAPNQMARDGKTSPPDGVMTTTRCASWISGESSSPSSLGGLRVDFTPSALGDLARFHGRDECQEAECPLCLHHLADGTQARQALTALLSADPRSLHRKNNCSDRLYYCVVDVLHVTAWFDVGRVEVLKVAPLALMDAVSNLADTSGSSYS